MRYPIRPQWPKFIPLLPWHPRAPPPSFVPRRIATTAASNAAPVDLPKLIIAPGSKNHNSLPSFLEYAKRTKLAPKTTMYVGTHYEYTAALALMRLGFSLLRIGRRHDAGIDLIGHWVLAPLREPLPVIIQCKARRASATPSQIRELEGSFQGRPADWRNKDVLGLLVTTKKATKGVLEALGQSRWPMGFVLVTRDGTVQQFLWNRAAAERGLEGVGVTVRHTPRAFLAETEGEKEGEEVEEEEDVPSKLSKKQLAKFKNAGTHKDIQLTWMGSPIFPERKTLADETLDMMRHIVPGDEVSYAAEKWKAVKKKLGRPRTDDKDPSPRGGLVRGKRGRPKGSKNKPKVGACDVPGKRGRPKGSKNKPKVVDTG